MANISITGATGFVGSHLAAHLKQVKAIPEGDYIINLASKSSVAESIENPAQFVKNNIDCMLEALEDARQRPLKLFVHFSTVEVYNVSNPYSASKLAQEALATAYSKTYGIPLVITTTNNIIGADQKGDKFVPRLVHQIKNGDEVQIYTDNGSMGYRIYNPVANVVDALDFIIRMENPAPKYHIGGGQELTNLEIAQKIAELLGKPLKYKLVEANTVRPGYTRHLIADGARLEDFGWKPPQTLDEGLKCLM